MVNTGKPERRVGTHKCVVKEEKLCVRGGQLQCFIRVPNVVSPFTFTFTFTC